ncbi:hypothetical protein [Marivita sp.]|uniref:hypothetical protein n=1 Tax=Marivita sp. TaxID=2003365 RepID=UPI003F72A6D6
MTKKRPKLPSGGGSYIRNANGTLRVKPKPTKERLRAGAEQPVEAPVETPPETPNEETST